MLKTRNWRSTVAIGGCALAVISWICAALGVRSILGDVFAPNEWARQEIVAMIDFHFRLALFLGATTFLSSIGIACWGWRRTPVQARIILGLHSVAIAAILASLWM
ncbi:MAG: hypothetical protein V4805_10025 [Pseudomonadota bacterium]